MNEEKIKERILFLKSEVMQKNDEIADYQRGIREAQNTVQQMEIACIAMRGGIAELEHVLKIENNESGKLKLVESEI